MSTGKQKPIIYPQPIFNDEINLIDIIKLLLRRKNLILGIVFTFIFIGLFYAFSQQRVYQVDTILLPPSFENVQPLNILALSSSDVLSILIKNMKSRKLQKAFFDEFKISEILTAHSTQPLSEKENNDIFEGFLKSITINRNKNSGSVKITLEGVHKEKIGPWLDAFVIMANEYTKDQLVRNIQSNLEIKTKKLKISISSKRSINKKIHEDELGRLTESYQIAKELGIVDHLFVPNVEGSSNQIVSAALNSISKNLTNEQHLSVYMKGTRFLQAEINAIKNRKSTDMHIQGLREIQEALTQLESITIDKDLLQTAIIDKKAIVNVETIGPNRKLIVIISLILGVLLGVFSVFIIEFVSNIKKQFVGIST